MKRCLGNLILLWRRKVVFLKEENGDDPQVDAYGCYKVVHSNAHCYII